jgi:hypothetical protein
MLVVPYEDVIMFRAVRPFTAIVVRKRLRHAAAAVDLPRRGDGGRVAARESFFSPISIPRHVKRRKTQRTTRIETCQFED